MLYALCSATSRGNVSKTIKWTATETQSSNSARSFSFKVQARNMRGWETQNWNFCSCCFKYWLLPLCAHFGKQRFHFSFLSALNANSSIFLPWKPKCSTQHNLAIQSAFPEFSRLYNCIIAAYRVKKHIHLAIVLSVSWKGAGEAVMWGTAMAQSEILFVSKKCPSSFSSWVITAGFFFFFPGFPAHWFFYFFGGNTGNDITSLITFPINCFH